MKLRKLLICFVLTVGSLPCVSEDCGLRKDYSPDTIVAYIKASSSDDKSAVCVSEAYITISILPAQKAVPALLQLLGTARPATRGEESGVSTLRSTPNEVYPALKLLFDIGESAQPEVLDYIIHDTSGTPIAWKNAIYLLNELQYGDFQKAFVGLKEKRALLTDPLLIARTNAALQELKKYCSSPRFAERCEAAAR